MDGRRRGRRVAMVGAALLIGAAWTAPVVSAAPAGAVEGAQCGADDVTVVVDYGELGDGVRQGCAEDADDELAADIFPEAGFPLEYAVRSAGFVCRVTGVPADAGCVDAAPATAYWSLWWTAGDSGTWTYASRGPQALRVPAGGYVAFVWHQGSGRAEPPAMAPGASGVPEPGAEEGAPVDGVADSGRGRDDDGLPFWIPVAGGLAVVGAGLAVARRRRSA